MACTTTDYALRDDQAVLYIVRVVDKMVQNDEDAYNEFYVRADNPLEAHVRAILRHGITEETLGDFDIHVERKFAVSKVDEDAE